MPDLNAMLGEVLLANLTNILTDSVTYTITKTLSKKHFLNYIVQ